MMITVNGASVAVVQTTPGEKVVTDAQSALDLAMTVQYEYHTNRIAISKDAVADAFFVLSSGMAGEVLQKYVNYHIKVAIYGDFSRYTSKPLHDFIYESNQGRDVFFVATKEDAVAILEQAE